jgi:hypothetical protein
VYDPLVAIRVKLCTRDAGVEPDVTAQTELLVDVVEIGAKLLPRGIELAVVSIPPEFLAGELIQRPVRIDPGARIAVPVPDAADVLKYLHVVTKLAQVVELVDTSTSNSSTAFPFAVLASCIAFIAKFLSLMLLSPGPSGRLHPIREGREVGRVPSGMWLELKRA